MAEIDRMKALAGLLDDDDDDLFPSSSDDSTDPAKCHENKHMNNPDVSMKIKQPSNSPMYVRDKFRDGIVKSQQQDNILMEMQLKKTNATQTQPEPKSDISRLNTISSSPVKSVTARPKLGQPRLSIKTDEPTENNQGVNDSEEDDRLIFGRPRTFGAAGGYDETYMPNVKERAMAISTWKILELKKERKNGHARAREWAVTGEVAVEENDENVMTNRNQDTHVKEEKVCSEKKSKIPSFLAHFDDTKDDENVENSQNGVICQPTTPRGGGRRVPLSPRTVSSPRNIGNIGVSPNVTSPKAIGGQRSLDGKLKINIPPSPRNKVSKNQLLSPKNSAILSPLSMQTKTVPGAQKPQKKSSLSFKPPMSPHGVRCSAKPTTNNKIKLNNVTESMASVTSDGQSVKNIQLDVKHKAKKTVHFKEENGVESEVITNQELINNVVESDTICDVEKWKKNQPSRVMEKIIDKQPCRHDRSGISNEDNQVKRKKFPVLNKTIHQTLEEASQFLQRSINELDEWDEESITNGDSVDSRIDHELTAAEELARKLEVFVKSHSPSRDETEDIDVPNEEIIGGSKECSTQSAFSSASELHTYKQYQNADPGWDKWNLSEKADSNNERFPFSVDFDDTCISQLDAVGFSSSSSDDALCASEQSPMKSNHVSRSNKNGLVDQKESSKVKIKLRIDGAPTLNIDQITSESMFFVSQPSPSCEDNEGLLGETKVSKNSSSVSEVESRLEIDAPNKRGNALNSPTKKRLNGLLSNILPEKHERSKSSDSPSNAGLLSVNWNTTSTGADKNVALVSSMQLRELSPNIQQSKHFFDAPSSPLMFGSLVPASPQKKNAKTHQATAGKMKKTAHKILKRIKTPLMGRKLGRTELNDDASFGEA